MRIYQIASIVFDIAWLVFLFKLCCCANDHTRRKSCKMTIVVLGLLAQLIFTFVPFALMQWASPKTLLQGSVYTFFNYGDGLDTTWLYIWAACKFGTLAIRSIQMLYLLLSYLVVSCRLSAMQKHKEEGISKVEDRSPYTFSRTSVTAFHCVLVLLVVTYLSLQVTQVVITCKFMQIVLENLRPDESVGS